MLIHVELSSGCALFLSSGQPEDGASIRARHSTTSFWVLVPKNAIPSALQNPAEDPTRPVYWSFDRVQAIIDWFVNAYPEVENCAVIERFIVIGDFNEPAIVARPRR